MSKIIRPSLNFHFDYEYDRDTLVNEDTYDVLPIVISFKDEDDNVMRYANKAINIQTKGPIEVLGGENQTLLGGQLTLYVKSKQEVGKGIIKITSELESKEIELNIK